MLVSMQNTALIDKLVVIAEGDIDLVQRAIRESAVAPNEPADLEKVVQFIVKARGRKAREGKTLAVA